MSIYGAFKKAIALHDETCSDYISTAHTVKGLEFDRVIIENDFRSVFDTINTQLVKVR